MLKNIKYIRMIKAVKYSMIMISLILCFISVSCQNEDTISEQISDGDAVTVRLHLSARGVENTNNRINNFWGNDPDNWFQHGNLFYPPSLPKIALMVFNKEQNRYVYSKLVTFQTGIGDGEYQIKIRLPKGESEFYAFYAPNLTGLSYGGSPKDVPYYTPEGTLRNNIPWDFSEGEAEEISMNDIQGAALPAIISGIPWEKESKPSLPENNPYDGLHPSPSDEKIIKILPQTGVNMPYQNNMHIGMLSGKTTAILLPSSGSTVQDITIPLYRDYSRITLDVVKADQTTKYYFYVKKIAFLNFPVMMSPSFRENDSDIVQLSRSTPSGKNMGHTGVFSYGMTGEEYDYAPPSIFLTANGAFDYEGMLNYWGLVPLTSPQYLAPYLPNVNSWQKEQEHPKILLEVGWCYGDHKPYKDELGSKTWVFDVGEESSPGVYSGPIYPNREYRVLVVIPELLDQEIVYRVESWNSKKVDLPPFQ